MFFVFGSPRSGTTLLAQCLSNHTDVFIPYETDFIVPLAFTCFNVKDPDPGREIIAKSIIHSSRFDEHFGEHMSREDVQRIVFGCDYHPNVIVEALFSELARLKEAKIAGDKSPNDLMCLRILIAAELIGPTTKIVHLVRDVRDVLNSLMKTNWDPTIDSYFARTWSSSNLYLHTLFHDKQDRYVLVRYEDLVADPKSQLLRICELLNVPFQEKMVASQEFHPRYKNISVHEKLYKPISNSYVGGFRKEVPKHKIACFEKQAREALEVFGYRSRFPWPFSLFR